MLIDSQLQFSDAQAVTATAISANVLDTQTLQAGAGTNIGPNASVNFGIGDGELYLVVQTKVACTDVGSDATLAVTLETATDVGLTAGVVVLATSPTLAFAAYSAAGSSVFVTKMPIGSYKRYLGVRYTVAAGPLTAGAFDAMLVNDAQLQAIYKSGYTVQ